MLPCFTVEMMSWIQKRVWAKGSKGGGDLGHLLYPCTDGQDQTSVLPFKHSVSSRQDDVLHPLHLHPLRYSWIASCKPLKLTSSKRGSKHNFRYSVPNESENDFPRKTARASKWGSNGEPFKHLSSACSLQQDRTSRIEGGWLMYQQHQYLMDTVSWNRNK